MVYGKGFGRNEEGHPHGQTFKQHCNIESKSAAKRA
jgi:hypothetical protein